MPYTLDLHVVDFVGGASLKFVPAAGTLYFYGQPLPCHVFLTAGVGLVTTLETCVPGKEEGCSAEPDPSTGRGLRRPAIGDDAYHIAGTFGLGARLGLVGPLGLRWEVRDVVYRDRVADPPLPFAEPSDDPWGNVARETKNILLVDLGLSLAF